MSIYKQLSLAAGGGIVSTQQKTDQVKNTASIIIGLGGTGNTAIRHVKTQVYDRLIPDDPDAIVPEYSHIRFIGIDTIDPNLKTSNDQEQMGSSLDSLRELSEGEYFYIGTQEIGDLIENDRLLNVHKEYQWIYRGIEPTSMGNQGAGGIRQVGRLMMMDRSEQFYNRLKEEVQNAVGNLTNPQLNIHIVSGLSGGTGSGAFLDVCYMAREIASRYNGSVFGYFFLPDVNLSKLDSSKSKIKDYIIVNGYNSMQELDYCMQIPGNGGSFIQQYGNRKKIEWKKPPVDMCHLIGTESSKGLILKNPFDYSMNVVSEYLMDFLTAQNSKDFTISEHLSNFNQMIDSANAVKLFGADLKYLTIGASCCVVPFKEINTYLASELFNRFSAVKNHVPSKEDVNNFAAKYLGKGITSVDQLYDSLMDEIRKDAAEDFIPNDFKAKTVKQESHHILIPTYNEQKNQIIGIYEKNKKSLQDDKNTDSLISRTRKGLNDYICDLSKGSRFSYGIISASTSHNLENILDGMQARNEDALSDHLRNVDFHNRNFEEARRNFDNSNALNMNKRLKTLEDSIRQIYLNEIDIQACQTMQQVIDDFRKKLKAESSFYLKFDRIINNLIETFDENRSLLNTHGFTDIASDSFSEPMMTIEELKPALDEKLETISTENMLKNFMSYLLDHQKEWITEDEDKLTKLVRDFFTEDVFRDYANMSITSFLKSKYNNEGNEYLTNKIYDDYIKPKMNAANPLFKFNGTHYSEKDASKIAYISYPEESAPIASAVKKGIESNRDYQSKASKLRDRIFLVSCSAAFPMFAFKDMPEYEQKALNDQRKGSHYYEGHISLDEAENENGFFDWQALPSITPASMLDEKSVPEKVMNQKEKAEALKKAAEEHGIIQHSSSEISIMEFDSDNIPKLDAILSKIQESSNGSAQDLETVLEDLENEINSLEPKFNKTGYTLRNAENGSYEKEIELDYFVKSPYLQKIVQKSEDQLQLFNQKKAGGLKQIEKKQEKLHSAVDDIDYFVKGLLSGVIEGKGMNMIYQPESLTEEEMTLCSTSTDYPYRNTPIIQAFLTFGNLDPSVKEEIRNRSEIILSEEGGTQTLADKIAGAEKMYFLPNKIRGYAADLQKRKNGKEYIRTLSLLKENFDTAKDLYLY